MYGVRKRPGFFLLREAAIPQQLSGFITSLLGVRCCLPVVLPCVSWRTGNVELCYFSTFYIVFGEMSIQILCPLKKVALPVYCWHCGSLCILCMLVPYQKCDLQAPPSHLWAICSHSWWYCCSVCNLFWYGSVYLFLLFLFLLWCLD